MNYLYFRDSQDTLTIMPMSAIKRIYRLKKGINIETMDGQKFSDVTIKSVCESDNIQMILSLNKEN